MKCHIRSAHTSKKLAKIIISDRFPEDVNKAALSQGKIYLWLREKIFNNRPEHQKVPGQGKEESVNRDENEYKVNRYLEEMKQWEYKFENTSYLREDFTYQEEVSYFWVYGHHISEAKYPGMVELDLKENIGKC